MHVRSIQRNLFEKLTPSQCYCPPDLKRDERNLKKTLNTSNYHKWYNYFDVIVKTSRWSICRKIVRFAPGKKKDWPMEFPLWKFHMKSQFFYTQFVRFSLMLSPLYLFEIKKCLATIQWEDHNRHIVKLTFVDENCNCACFFINFLTFDRGYLLLVFLSVRPWKW